MSSCKISVAKRPQRIPLVALVVLLGLMSAVQYAWGKERTSPEVQSEVGLQFRVLVPRFEAETGAQLGYNVTFALVHEIFRTFNKSTPYREDGKYDNRDTCCIRNDAVAVLERALARQTHDDAYARAVDEQAQLVLWGKAWLYGADVVVQPFLTIAPSPQHLAHAPESMTRGSDDTGQAQWQWLVWQITATGEGETPATVSLTEFPSLQYEMSPVVFDSAKLELFASFENMPVYAEKSVTSRQVGATGSKMQAREHAPGGWTKITRPEGWIKLPDLDATDTVEYVGGLAHFMRGNWKRARISFERVMQTPEAPTQVRRDAALLLAAALFRLDPTCANCETAMEFAENLNPYSLATAKYYFMASLASARRSNDATVWQGVQDRLDRIRSLAPEDDVFVINAGQVLDLLRKQAGVVVSVAEQ